MRPETALLLAVLALAPLDRARADEIDRLIEGLGDPSWEIREASMAALIERGRSAGPRLRALDPDDPEVRWRVLRILEAVDRLRTSPVHLVVVLGEDGGRRPRFLQAGFPVTAEVAAEIEDGFVVAGRFLEDRFDGRMGPRGAEAPVVLEPGRLRRLGILGGSAVYALLRRDADWVEGDPAAGRAVIASALRDQIEGTPAGEFDLGIPDAFRLVLEVSGFEELALPLSRRGAASGDPFVRDLCARAVERQTRGIDR